MRPRWNASPRVREPIQASCVSRPARCGVPAATRPAPPQPTGPAAPPQRRLRGPPVSGVHRWSRLRLAPICRRLRQPLGTAGRCSPCRAGPPSAPEAASSGAAMPRANSPFRASGRSALPPCSGRCCWPCCVALVVLLRRRLQGFSGPAAGGGRPETSGIESPRPRPHPPGRRRGDPKPWTFRREA